MSKEQGKLVSIVLPVYNGADNVSHSIDSILSQTYKNIELIIVNDCSTDNTLEVITRYQKRDSRVKVVSNAMNLKLPMTLNRGFKEAEGYYFTWTSDDNIYKDNAIEKMVLALEKHTEIDMVYANFTNIDADGKEIGRVLLEEPARLYSGNVIGACFLYTREIAMKVGEYDPTLFLAEDYDYWIRIWKVGKVLHIEDDLYYYRRHAGSLSETRKSQIGLQTYRTLEKHFLFINEAVASKKQRYDFYDHMMVRLSNDEDEKNVAMRRLLKVDKGYQRYIGQKEARTKFRNALGTIRQKLKGNKH